MTPRLAPSTFIPRRATAQQRRQARAWLGPLCVAASLAAHGVLLALVVPRPQGEPQPAAVRVEEPAKLEDVAVTVLPKSVTTAAPPAENVAPPPQPSAVAPRVQPTPQPVAPQPAAPRPVAPVDSPPASPTAAPPEPAAFTPPPPPPTEAEPEPPAPYANFPHLDGAQAACEGLADCWRSPVSSSWRGAASDLQARLEAQGYTLNNVTGEVLSIDSGVRIYAVSKPGEASYYLNLVSVREGVLYTMTAEPMTSDQVLTLQRS
ncbi:SPOR domain-containing protein [Nodosilinea sp. AN01ver1]|uniref:SPOR domain-containing protein n=1 Tax=Nodosilinea sp. AN01ver1 TaxID=3423362 RepID=UPI003D31DC0C